VFFAVVLFHSERHNVKNASIGNELLLHSVLICSAFLLHLQFFTWFFTRFFFTRSSSLGSSSRFFFTHSSSLGSSPLTVLQSERNVILVEL